MSEVRIILLCGSRFALPALKELAFFNMLKAVVIPRVCDEMVENARVVLNGTGIPVVELDEENFELQIRDEAAKQLANLGLMMTFSYKIPSSLFNLFPLGFYNVHPGPLPQYRGADPVFQQIKNREKQAGVTIHKVDEGFDTGAVVIKEMMPLETTDTYGLLTTKLSQLAAKLIGTIIKLAAYDIPIPSRPQDKSNAKYFKKQGAKDITIDWDQMDAATIVALINACNPWNKGAVTKINNQVIRLLEAEPLNENMYTEKTPGCILLVDEKGMIVSTIREQAIKISFVSTDEGFIKAGRLSLIGVSAGSRFEKF